MKQIQMPAVTGYHEISSSSFFAASNVLVSLIRASRPIGQNGSHTGSAGPDYFLSTSDRDGDHGKLVHLDLDFDAVKVAAFDSGEFIVLGSARTSPEPVMVLLNGDGRLISHLDTFSSDSGTGSSGKPEATKVDPPKDAAVTRPVGAAKFVPWGSDILMAAPGIDGTAIYHFRASGRIERIPLKLPGDEQIEGILGAGPKDNWVVRTRTAASRKTMATARVIVNPEEYLYEVNPHNGEILRRLNVEGPVPGEVACAADGKLAAMYVTEPPRQGAPMKLSLATAIR